MYDILHPDSPRKLPSLRATGGRVVRDVHGLGAEEFRYNERPGNVVPGLHSSKSEEHTGAVLYPPMQSPRKSDLYNKPKAIPDSRDPRMAVALYAQVQDLAGNVNELQRREYELRTRAHTAWTEQQERVEAARQEYGAALTDLRHELRSRLEAAEQKQQDFLLQGRFSPESV